MFNSKRVGLGVLLGLLAALAVAVPAQADVKAECVITGEAKVDDKASPNPNIGVLLVGGSGTYQFNSLNIVCVGTEKSSVPVVVALTVTSQGKYENIVCGTGTAWSPAGSTVLNTFNNVSGTSTKGQAFYAALINGLTYKVQFVGTVGTFHVNNDPDPTGVKNVPKVDLSAALRNGEKSPGPASGLDEAGVIQLSPPNPAGAKPTPVPPAMGNCTKAFTVEGTVHLYQV